MLLLPLTLLLISDPILRETANDTPPIVDINKRSPARTEADMPEVVNDPFEVEGRRIRYLARRYGTALQILVIEARLDGALKQGQPIGIVCYKALRISDGSEIEFCARSQMVELSTNGPNPTGPVSLIPVGSVVAIGVDERQDARFQLASRAQLETLLAYYEDVE